MFNGSGWTPQALPTWVERPVSGSDIALASAVFSPTNVWAFSIDAQNESTLAGHYTGGSWHKAGLPVIPNTVAGLAPNDIWIYGFAPNFGPRTLAHWNGTAWQTVSPPSAPKGATLVATEMVALGAKSVWLSGELFAKSGKVTFELLHWDGTGTWTATGVPSSAGTVNQFASDGNGGFWLIASNSTTGSHFVHYTGGPVDVLPDPGQGQASVRTRCPRPLIVGVVATPT